MTNAVEALEKVIDRQLVKKQKQKDQRQADSNSRRFCRVPNTNMTTPRVFSLSNTDTLAQVQIPKKQPKNKAPHQEKSWKKKGLSHHRRGLTGKDCFFQDAILDNKHCREEHEQNRTLTK